MYCMLITLCCCMSIVLFSAVGIISGITFMLLQTQSMLYDPSSNGTKETYKSFFFYEILLFFNTLFGFHLCYEVWKNSYRVDNNLLTKFILWFTLWISSAIGIVCMAAVTFNRIYVQDGQLGFMYEIFQKRSLQDDFINWFQSYQREHNCCGLHGPKDWLTAGEKSQRTLFDDYVENELLQMNSIASNCYITSLIDLPKACGPTLLNEISNLLKLYCGLALGQQLFVLIASQLALNLFTKDQTTNNPESTTRIGSGDVESPKNDEDEDDNISDVTLIVDTYSSIHDEDAAITAAAPETPFHAEGEGTNNDKIIVSVGNHNRKHSITTTIPLHPHDHHVFHELHGNEQGSSAVGRPKDLIPFKDSQNLAGQSVHQDSQASQTQSSVIEHQPQPHESSHRQKDLIRTPSQESIEQSSSIVIVPSDDYSPLHLQSLEQPRDEHDSEQFHINSNEPPIQIGYVTKSQLENHLFNLKSDPSTKSKSWKISGVKLHSSVSPSSGHHSSHQDDEMPFSNHVHHKSTHDDTLESRTGSHGFDVSPLPEYNNQESYANHSDQHGSTYNPHHHHNHDHHHHQNSYLSQSTQPQLQSLYRAGSYFNNSSDYSAVEVPQPSYTINHPSQLPRTSTRFTSTSRKGKQDPEEIEHEIVEKEEKAILKDVLHGGKVVGEIKIEHKFDRDGKPIDDFKHDRKLATLAIIRNKHATDPPPPPPGHHGQTGHLAEDIAEMTGNAKLKVKIDDLKLPEVSGRPPPRQAMTRKHIDEKSEKKVFGRVTGPTAQNHLEDLIISSHVRREEEKKEKERQAEKALIKPHYIFVTHKPHPESTAHRSSEAPRHGISEFPPQHSHDYEYLEDNEPYEFPETSHRLENTVSNVGHNHERHHHHHHHPSNNESPHQHHHHHSGYLYQSSNIGSHSSYGSGTAESEDPERGYEHDQHQQHERRSSSLPHNSRSQHPEEKETNNHRHSHTHETNDDHHFQENHLKEDSNNSKSSHKNSRERNEHSRDE